MPNTRFDRAASNQCPRVSVNV